MLGQEVKRRGGRCDEATPARRGHEATKRNRKDARSWELWVFAGGGGGSERGARGNAKTGKLKNAKTKRSPDWSGRRAGATKRQRQGREGTPGSGVGVRRAGAFATVRASGLWLGGWDGRRRRGGTPASRGTRRNTRNQSGNAAECASSGGWAEEQDEENGRDARRVTDGNAGAILMALPTEIGDCLPAPPSTIVGVRPRFILPLLTPPDHHRGPIMAGSARYA